MEVCQQINMVMSIIWSTVQQNIKQIINTNKD
jgi:hypothetical protein